MPQAFVFFGLLFSSLLLVPPDSHSEPRKPRMAQGAVGMYKFRSSSDGIERSVLYYIPDSIENPFDFEAPSNVMIFLHGGGQTTVTEKIVQSVGMHYAQVMEMYSYHHQTIVILPTTTFGWNAHTPYLMKELIQDLKKRIPVDPSRLVLAGHSMGGMGITREYTLLAPLFSGVLALSAGIQDESFSSEDLITPYLNQTPYIHLNGEQEGFKFFNPQMDKFKLELNAVESQYGIKSKFDYRMHDGGHFIALDPMTKALDELYSEKSMQNYQQSKKSLFLRFTSVNFSKHETQPALRGEMDQAYWVSISGYTRAQQDQALEYRARVQVVGQKITVTPTLNTLNPKNMTFELTSELLDLKQTVSVELNGKEIYSAPLPSSSRGVVHLTVQL